MRVTDVRLGVTDVASIRFAVSPLWETLASLRVVADPGRHAVHLPWITHAARLLDRRDIATRVAPLRAVMHPYGHPPPLLTPPPNCPLAEIEQELAVVAAAPAVLDGIRCWWTAAIEPYWPRMRAILESDIAFRARRLAEDGVTGLFDGLHPDVAWTGDRLVVRDRPGFASTVDTVGRFIDPGGRGLPLAPSIFATGCTLLCGHEGTPAPYGLIYPVRAVGTVWERRRVGTNSLARLLGRSRAELLAHTSSPATTTQLAARTGLSLGTVSQHLAVLREAGLVTSSRYRREVNYTVTELGVSLLQPVAAR
jgi:DNA-binding transcriptional ArsR family regulator